MELLSLFNIQKITVFFLGIEYELAEIDRSDNTLYNESIMFYLLLSINDE